MFHVTWPCLVFYPNISIRLLGDSAGSLSSPYKNWSVRMAERLTLPTSDHRVAGSNPAGGEILPKPKRRFIAQSLSCSPFHRLEMTEILLKGRKTLTHPSIHPYKNFEQNKKQFPPTIPILKWSANCNFSIRSSNMFEIVHFNILMCVRRQRVGLQHGNVLSPQCWV